LLVVSADRPAGITMDDRSVYIATSSDAGDVLTMPFVDAEVAEPDSAAQSAADVTGDRSRSCSPPTAA
jgi:hypothetical protein